MAETMLAVVKTHPERGIDLTRVDLIVHGECGKVLLLP